MLRTLKYTVLTWRLLLAVRESAVSAVQMVAGISEICSTAEVSLNTTHYHRPSNVKLASQLSMLETCSLLTELGTTDQYVYVAYCSILCIAWMLSFTPCLWLNTYQVSAVR